MTVRKIMLKTLGEVQEWKKVNVFTHDIIAPALLLSLAAGGLQVLGFSRHYHITLLQLKCLPDWPVEKYSK